MDMEYIGFEQTGQKIVATFEADLWWRIHDPPLSMKRPSNKSQRHGAAEPSRSGETWSSTSPDGLDDTAMTDVHSDSPAADSLRSWGTHAFPHPWLEVTTRSKDDPDVEKGGERSAHAQPAITLNHWGKFAFPNGQVDV
jgi:hypothetical protein